MTPALTTVVLVVAGLVTLFALAEAGLGRAPGPRLLQSLFGLQAVLVVQLGYVLYRLSGGDRPAEGGAFAAYVVLSLLLLPGGLALSADEQSRYGTLVIAVAVVATAVIELRLVATWS